MSDLLLTFDAMSEGLVVPAPFGLQGYPIGSTEYELRPATEDAEGDVLPPIRMRTAPVEDSSFADTAARLLGSLRIQLTDSFVVESAIEQHPEFESALSALVAFRSGLIGQSLYLFLGRRRDRDYVMTATCGAHAAAFFGPYFKNLTNAVSFGDQAPT